MDGQPAIRQSTNSFANTQRNPRHSCIRVNSWTAGPHPALHQRFHDPPTKARTFVHSCCRFVDGQPAPDGPPTVSQTPNGIQDIRVFVLSIRGRPARHPAVHQQLHKHPTESKTFVYSCCRFVDGQPASGNPPTISQTPNGIQDIRVFVLSIRGRPARARQSTNSFANTQWKQRHSCIRAIDSWTASPHPELYQRFHDPPTKARTFVHSCCQFVDGRPAPSYECVSIIATTNFCFAGWTRVFGHGAFYGIYVIISKVRVAVYRWEKIHGG